MSTVSAFSTAIEAPADLRLQRLRKRVGQLRELLAEGLALIGEVYESDDWKLVASSWEEFCAAELPELAQLRLEPEKRQAVILDLAGRGLSQRAIGAPLGLSPQTVMRELKRAGVERDTVKGRDGRQRPAVAAARPVPVSSSVPNTDRAVSLVAAAGPDGLTVRELCRKTGWHHGQASGTLSRLAKQRRVRAVAVFRDNCAAYVLPA